KTDMAEFIDMEHTPKNVLIRCIKKNKGNKDALNEYYALKEQYGNFSQTLENRLKDNGYIK
ncbi:MAG: SAM-dependent methyltransferase, partial [Clostridia bacterium]|nr:SAM-dependent methyltransferase [Clostridia bacterium]